MNNRILYAIIMILSLIIIIFLFGKVLTSFLLMLIFLGLYDEIQVFFLQRERFFSEYFNERHVLYYFFTNFFLLLLFPQWIKILFIISTVLCLIHILLIVRKDFFNPKLVLFYIATNMVMFIYFFHYEHWIKFLLGIVTLTALTDTGGLFFGKNFGKNLMAPSISPNKTWEGFFGGLFLGSLGASFVHSSFDKFFIFVCLSALAQLGDLLESYFKRQYNIKDSSNLIPGHGGLYDRLDSLIFIIPFYCLWILGS